MNAPSIHNAGESQVSSSLDEQAAALPNTFAIQ
jgi:hypothetical protein